MKRVNIAYWIVTVLMAAFMALGAVPDTLQVPDAMAQIGHLGYPAYFPRFIGVLKLAGIAGIFQTRFPRLKEWAYAGLVFDTFGAAYSGIANGDGPAGWAPALIALGLVLASYILYSRRAAMMPAPALQ